MTTAKERLEEELNELRAENKRGLFVSGTLLGVIAIYLLWATSQLNILLDPEGMAEAATGVAVESIPEVSKSLTLSIKEGAPAIAQQTSGELLELVPMYRNQLEGEIKPVIDEVAAILADSSIQSAIASIDKAQGSDILKQEAAAAATDAVIAELDGILIEALVQKNEEGTTPQESIDAALSGLRGIDKELKKMSKGGGNAQERELLLTWINIVSQE